jgi:hypothetical protein
VRVVRGAFLLPLTSPPPDCNSTPQQPQQYATDPQPFWSPQQLQQMDGMEPNKYWSPATQIGQDPNATQGQEEWGSPQAQAPQAPQQAPGTPESFQTQQMSQAVSAAPFVPGGAAANINPSANAYVPPDAAAVGPPQVRDCTLHACYRGP